MKSLTENTKPGTGSLSDGGLLARNPAARIARELLTGWLVCSVCLLHGCVGYQLGSTLPEKYKVIWIPTFQNQTGQPLIEVSATNETIAEFQQDGTLQIGRVSNADLILEVVLTSLELDPISYDKSERSTPNEYRLTLKAKYVLKEAGTGQVVGEGSGVSGDTTFLYVGNLASAKRRASKDAAEDLGRRLVEEVVEIW